MAALQAELLRDIARGHFTRGSHVVSITICVVARGFANVDGMLPWGCVSMTDVSSVRLIATVVVKSSGNPCCVLCM